MTLTAKLTADMRSRASFLAFCPLCTVLGVIDTPDHLIGPSHRKFREYAKLDACCSLSQGCPPMASQADVAIWWHAKRQQALTDPATNNRRLSVLAKLSQAELEPVE